MGAPLLIGGAPPVILRAARPEGRPGFVEATVLPGRGFMLLQAVIERPSGERTAVLHAPALDAAAAALDGGPEDFAGNASFRFGGAILAPFANRIRGRALADTREVETPIAGRRTRLPRNWGGQAAGAETYAMHGLVLATQVPHVQAAPDEVSGVLEDCDFGGRWPGRLRLEFAWRLAGGALRLDLTATNVGQEPTVFGAGWHPYFRLPGGDRRQARLRVPAALRAEVNDYDEVLPTGRLLEVAGTPYDFQIGRALGDLYLDDCFTGLQPRDGHIVVEVEDPDAGHGLRVAATSPPVRAVQVYAPPSDPFVVVEPQFNLADPFGEAWASGVETGMAALGPGASTRYEAWVSAYDPGGQAP